jgi:hypothetical protein
VVLAGVCLVLSGLLIGIPPEPAVPSSPQVPGLVFGVTHGRSSADDWNAAPAVRRATGLLGEVAGVQNQHLMGWGALNPEPSRDRYDFSSLDSRIDMITGMGAEPVLTLCCAPDWMKGGEPGTTDWSQLEKAPSPEHYDDFAALAAVAAQRYPQVRRFIVWNELKGFYDEASNNWDSVHYTELYNKVYTAVKAVRPDAQLGGPYVVFDSWSSRDSSDPSDVSGPWGVLDQRPLDALDYWLEHAVGADFIAVDASTATRDRGLITTDFQANDKLAAITRWIVARSDLPLWWAEIYPTCSDASASPGAARRAAVMVDALIKVAQAGASVALLWQPQASADLRSVALFTDTADRNGGRALPLGQLLRAVEPDLRRAPGSLVTTWDPKASLWTLSTPDQLFAWSPRTGLVGPHPRILS